MDDAARRPSPSRYQTDAPRPELRNQTWEAAPEHAVDRNRPRRVIERLPGCDEDEPQRSER
jgi:hypothetical protein